MSIFHSMPKVITTFKKGLNGLDKELTKLEPELNDHRNDLPTSFRLYDNYPNPFNPKTILNYDLPQNSFVEVIVYDMQGKVVNNLVNANQSSGFKSIQWDATNNQGQPVSAGVYLCTIEAVGFRQTKNMILLK